jgi:hypothetical protein
MPDPSQREARIRNAPDLAAAKSGTQAGTPGEVFAAFLKLGCTAFGGPIAHLGYFQHEFVNRRKWIDEEAYADLVAWCQFLPGPASSQVGLAVGWKKGGMDRRAGALRHAAALGPAAQCPPGASAACWSKRSSRRTTRRGLLLANLDINHLGAKGAC